MSVHTGISCNSCRKKNFSDRRYKCLICTDYDLCSICYDRKSILSTQTHTMNHPMQMIVTSHDYEHIYFGYKHPSLSLTCPQCNRNGFSGDLLIKHIDQVHSHLKNFVLCPICFTRQNKLAEHLCQHAEVKKNCLTKISIHKSEEHDSELLFQSKKQSLLNKSKGNQTIRNDHDERCLFLRSLLTSCLSQKSFDNEKDIYT